MRDYAKVSPRFWTGQTGKAIRALGSDALCVALYLLTAPGSNMTGLYYLPLPTLAHETGIPIEGASKVLRSLSDVGFAHYDEDHEAVWVPEMARYQLGEALVARDKRHAGLLRELAPFGNCPFILDFWAKYAAAYHLPAECPHKPLRRGFGGPSEVLRSKEKEKEKEHEKDLGPESVPSAAPPGPAGGAEPAQLALASDEPTPPAAAKPKLPFQPLAAVAAVARASRGRFPAVEPRDLTRETVLGLQALIKAYPAIADWERVGRWLAAGGLGYRTDLGVSWAASNGMRDAMAAARAWEQAGGGPVARAQGPNAAPQVPAAPRATTAQMRAERDTPTTNPPHPALAALLAEERAAAKETSPR